jgi:hypothetical protein
MASADFVPDIAGIRAALSQPGIVSMLSEKAASIADSASDAAAGRYKAAKKIPAYRSYATQGHQYGVALGIVTTNTMFGERDEDHHKTLESFNH